MNKPVIAIIAGATLLWTAIGAALLWPDRSPDAESAAEPVRASSAAQTEGPDEASFDSQVEAGIVATGPSTDTVDAAEPPVSSARSELRPAAEQLQIRFRRPPAAGILFDVDSGEILWQRRPAARRPIASLTKMMTALLVTESHGRHEQVLVSSKASSTGGSATGVLPAGKRVPIEPLFEALIMISANDAAVALAEHDADSVGRFIKRMNRRSRQLGLACTRFSTPHGLKDRGNRSCALDLAALARLDLEDPWISRIAQQRRATPAFPIKGGRLHLANNHYFLLGGIARLPAARVTGLKTGLTDGAGRCYVTTARIGKTHLGVVLLDSSDPIRDVPKLMRAGFRASRAQA